MVKILLLREDGVILRKEEKTWRMCRDETARVKFGEHEEKACTQQGAGQGYVMYPHVVTYIYRNC